MVAASVLRTWHCAESRAQCPRRLAVGRFLPFAICRAPARPGINVEPAPAVPLTLVRARDMTEVLSQRCGRSQVSPPDFWDHGPIGYPWSP